MKIVADESVDYPIIARLREAGHGVGAIVELTPGITDTQVLDLANQQNHLLLTGDKDFGELIFRDRQHTCGIVLIRLAGLSPADKATIVVEVMAAYETQLANAFCVIARNIVRIRPQF